MCITSPRRRTLTPNEPLYIGQTAALHLGVSCSSQNDVAVISLAMYECLQESFVNDRWTVLIH